MKERVNCVLNEKIKELEILKNGDYINDLCKVVDVINDCIKKGNKVLIAGNGGSAADSQHFAAELVGRFVKERNALPAIALSTDSSNITSIGNDYGFEYIFSRQVEGLGKKGDIFVGLSTSGNSKNIIEAVKKSKENGLITIGLLGKDGGKLKEMCDYNITFPYSETARIQEHHLMTYHLICEFVEEFFYEKTK